MPALLAKALAHGGDTHTIADLHAGIKAGRFQFFGGEDSAVVTEIMDYPRKRILHVFLAAGDFRAVMAHLPELRKFARDHGCAAITTLGRKGFRRKSRLPAYGFKPKQTLFELDLEDKDNG